MRPRLRLLGGSEKYYRNAFFAVSTAFVLLLLFVINQSTKLVASVSPVANVSPSANVVCPEAPACDVEKKTRVIPRWYDVAAKTTTDKINHHIYEVAYEKYLPRYFEKGSIKLLEIGLGCNMGKGPGASLKLWVEYFKDIKLDLHFMEYNEACAKKWEPRFPEMTMHIGDQGNVTDLKRIVERAGNDFDVIIDDGGHTMKQQITTMEYLIPNALKPGGLFFMEDLITSFEGEKIDVFYWDMGQFTMMKYMHDMLDDMTRSWYHRSSRMKRSGTNTVYSEILGIDCPSRGICVFEKMPEKADWPPSMKRKERVALG